MTDIANIPPNYVAAADCLKDRVILVTGATGSIGRIAALTFAKHGATVILHGRRQSKLDALYDEIEAAGGVTPANIVLDLLKAKEADFKAMAETIFATFKRCDGIFHAASHMEPLTPLALQDLTSWNAHMTVNVLAAVALTRACLPMLKRADNASVIFLTETHAISPKAYWGAFATSKAALTNIATIWNDEVANDSKLCFKLLLPGPIASQMRAMSHPGEHPSEQPHVGTIAPSLLYLIADNATPTDTSTLFQHPPSRD
jgi:NAD(P)-dependent dehydrogenase (short-subunit alcohol dehydrogenase family)